MLSLRIGGLVLLIALLGACLPSPPVRARSGTPLVATTGMVGDLVRAVAGSEFDVTTMMAPGVDPHLYQANPNDVRTLQSAEMVFLNGLNLEGRLGSSIEPLRHSKPVVFVGKAVGEGQLLGGPHGFQDPHIWMDVKLWSRASTGVEAALVARYPLKAEGFLVRGQALRAKLNRLNGEVREVLAIVPPERRVLVTAHDAFQYFGRAYGFEVHGIQGISTESEAGLRDVERLVDLLVTRRIPAIFVESTISPKNVQALIEGARARRHSVRLGGTLYSDAMGGRGSGADNYFDMIRHNARTIAEALK